MYKKYTPLLCSLQNTTLPHGCIRRARISRFVYVAKPYLMNKIVFLINLKKVFTKNGTMPFYVAVDNNVALKLHVCKKNYKKLHKTFAKLHVCNYILSVVKQVHKVDE